MDCFFARAVGATFRAFTPIPGSSATFSQTPCFLPSLTWLALRKASSSSKTSRTSGRITTRRSSPGKKTSTAHGTALQIATANVSGECGDFIYSVARAHFGRAVCRSFRFSFPKRTPPLKVVSASRDKPRLHRASQFFSSRAHASDRLGTPARHAEVQTQDGSLAPTPAASFHVSLRPQPAGSKCVSAQFIAYSRTHSRPRTISMGTYRWVRFFALGLLFVSLAPRIEARKHSAKKTAPKERQSSAQIEAAAHLQIFLDRSNFSPGKIDGHYNEFTWKALSLYWH